MNKTDENKCRICGATDQKLSSAGYCPDLEACTRRRQARAAGTAHLRAPCIVRLRFYGMTCYLREFGPKISSPPPVLPPGFTLKDYEVNPPRTYYETTNDVREASTFGVAEAVKLANTHNGTAVNR